MTKAQRNTRQRQVILEELRALTSHPTAAELYQSVRHRMPRISLGTVYRNLELLSRNGQIRKLETANSRTRFDGNVEPHLHIRCVRCERVTDVHDTLELPPLERVASLSGHEVLGMRLEFLGICERCTREMDPEEKERLRREWS